MSLISCRNLSLQFFSFKWIERWRGETDEKRKQTEFPLPFGMDSLRRRRLFMTVSRENETLVPDVKSAGNNVDPYAWLEAPGLKIITYVAVVGVVVGAAMICVLLFSSCVAYHTVTGRRRRKSVYQLATATSHEAILLHTCSDDGRNNSQRYREHNDEPATLQIAHAGGRPQRENHCRELPECAHSRISLKQHQQSHSELPLWQQWPPSAGARSSPIADHRRSFMAPKSPPARPRLRESPAAERRSSFFARRQDSIRSIRSNGEIFMDAIDECTESCWRTSPSSFLLFFVVCVDFTIVPEECKDVPTSKPLVALDNPPSASEVVSIEEESSKLGVTARGSACSNSLTFPATRNSLPYHGSRESKMRTIPIKAVYQPSSTTTDLEHHQPDHPPEIYVPEFDVLIRVSQTNSFDDQLNESRGNLLSNLRCDLCNAMRLELEQLQQIRLILQDGLLVSFTLLNRSHQNWTCEKNF